MTEYERDMWMLNASPQDMVREFIHSFKQEDVDPRLGGDLINEEFTEWLEEFEYESKAVDELKELTDLVYVCFWRAEKEGWDLMESLRRVHESNMSKLVDGEPIFRDDGKVLKGDNYFKPDLEDLV